MCDWGGGPNSMANYMPPVRPGTKREPANIVESNRKFIYRTQVLLILDGKESVIISDESEIQPEGLKEMVSKVAGQS